MVQLALMGDSSFKSLKLEGYRDDLVGTQGRQMFRHLFGGAGTSLAAPPLFIAQMVRDSVEYAFGNAVRRVESATEMRENLAGLSVAYSMLRASLSGSADHATGRIVSTLCK